LTELLNADDFERAASERLDPGVFDYVAGGGADEQTLRDNRAAFARWRLLPRVLRGLEASTETSVLGLEVSMPILTAPVAYQRTLHPEGDVAVARAASRAGTIQTLSTLSNDGLEEVVATAPDAPRFFQLYPYRDAGATREVIARAEAAGFRALVVTVDTVVLGLREREDRHGFALAPDLELPCVPVPAGHAGPITPADVNDLMTVGLSWADIERFAGLTRMPVLVKGVLHPEDARLAVEHGAAGVVVSNHGGRQLDGVPATIDVLEPVADAVRGRAEVLLDSGVRRGTDVLKALCLGASAVLLGRPVAYALAVGGEDGVLRLLELLRHELATALTLAGCASPADADRDLVYREAPRD
jgi:4-hydroxymandelate oxidase